jgi:beta-glucosidase
LSYTSFHYSQARVDNEHINADGTVHVSVDVSNTGSMAGDEVVQLYLIHPGVAGAPLRSLGGFRRIHLLKGQQRTVSFPLSGRDLGIVDEAGKHRIVPGTVEVWVGGGQSEAGKTAGAATRFVIGTEAELPD